MYGTMFVDLDWRLNASSLLSASAELVVTFIVLVGRILSFVSGKFKPKPIGFQPWFHRWSLVLAFAGGGLWRARQREPITGVWGLCPQRGPGAEPLVRGSGGRSPPEADAQPLLTFHKPIFAEFWCHFGEIQSFCKLLKLGLHQATCPLVVSFVSINDVALTSWCTYVA